MLARTSAADGHIIVSFTPVGEGAAAGITYRFLSEPNADRVAFRIPSEEVKHISEARREELASGYLEHERETRLEGTPQLGAGPVFPLELLPTVVRSFDFSAIPTWAKHVVGIDFGFDHPFAAVYLCWAFDTGQVWVLDSFRMERSSALYHTQRIHAMTRGARVPVCWPHDGHVHDKGSGLSLASQYRAFGANMLSSHAVNHGTNNFSLEPALEDCGSLCSPGNSVSRATTPSYSRNFATTIETRIFAS